MNIKEHIEAGHYPKDAKGRALVPHAEGNTVVICATDMPGGCPILGYQVSPEGNRVISPADCGFGYFPDSPQLLPPAPRKVKVTQYAVMVFGHASPWLVRDEEFAARNDAEARLASGRWTVIPLIGEYEEPWA